MEMEIRRAPRVTKAEAGRILDEEKAKDQGERREIRIPEASNTEKKAISSPAARKTRPLHDTFLKLDEDRHRKIGSLKAEVNQLTTEEYLAQGRSQEAMQAERKTHLERIAEHQAVLKRGEEIRRTRTAEASLLERFKKSLATMNERLFGPPHTFMDGSKLDNEQSAERPE